MLVPEIRNVSPKKLLGMKLQMNYANNTTGKLWQSFMPRRHEIPNTLNQSLYSLQVYPPTFSFADAQANFEKWAAVEVNSSENIPLGMEAFTLEGGLYAVFVYQGLSSDTRIFEYIFKTWLPASDYTLDNRPHFELLDHRYKNNDPSSEEEIWIPIKLKPSTS
ncbi:MAG: GyrI-like domain-containing protein [Bacteroidetes bacterium B1(2017)]|nr:MAG: GyrI-like domain-containing protein [Bacteroidetes bacterium B1(2017)]